MDGEDEDDGREKRKRAEGSDIVKGRRGSSRRGKKCGWREREKRERRTNKERTTHDYSIKKESAKSKRRREGKGRNEGKAVPLHQQQQKPDELGAMRTKVAGGDKTNSTSEVRNRT